VYEYEFKFELPEGRAGDKLSWKKKPKIKSEIPIVNGFHVELNFLEGVLSSVSYDDEIGVPFNRIRLRVCIVDAAMEGPLFFL
jgi:hypothetical protein